MDWDQIALGIGVVRDVTLILIFLVSLILLLVVFRKVSSILESARRTLKSTEDVVSTLSTRIVEPAASGSSVAFGIGKMASFIQGFSGSRRKKGGVQDG